MVRGVRADMVGAGVSDTDRFTLDVGRLSCSTVRDNLAEFRRLGYRIQWIEGRGMFSREFSVWGDAGHVQYVYSWLQRNVINGD